MTYDPHGTQDIPIGTPVIGFDGSVLGEVRESHPHYLLVGRKGRHDDLEAPGHAVPGLVGGKLQVSVNREAVSSIDSGETAHRPHEERRTN